MTTTDLSAALSGYLSVSQLAQRLGVTRQWARQLITRREVEAVETVLGWLVEPTSAQALVERRAAVQRPRPRSSLT